MLLVCDIIKHHIKYFCQTVSYFGHSQSKTNQGQNQTNTNITHYTKMLKQYKQYSSNVTKLQNQ